MQDAILRFTGSRGEWRLIGTESTGRHTCADTYRLVGTDEYQEIDRGTLHVLVKASKISPILGAVLNDLPVTRINHKKRL